MAEHQSGNKEEGYRLAKKGLRLDVASSLAYSALGVIYRNDRAFHQAMKYFQQALYHDPKSDRVMRDLASVQLHLRDYEGHLKSRKLLWKARPDLRVNWVGYALAAHLVGDFEFAFHLAKMIQESSLQDSDMPLERWEVQHQHSELLLYQNFVKRDAGDFEGALADLKVSQPKILDKILVREIMAELLLKTGKTEEAREAFLSLIHTNPDNITYHYGLLSALGAPELGLESIFTRHLDATGKATKATFKGTTLASLLSPALTSLFTSTYADLQKAHPKSLVTFQMPLLYWLEGAAFTKAFFAYARPLLAKGVPSLFNSVKSLYKSPSHVELIDKWIRSVVESLETKKVFPSEEGATSSPESNGTKSEDPTTLLWVYYFLALHECEQAEYEKALTTIEKAIAHTPTVMDVYLVKGKILAKAGDAKGAAEAVEKARTMDLADRNLNTLSVKYWLRAHQPVRAAQNMAIFTKLDLSHYSNVFTMQVMWYESERASSHLSLHSLDASSPSLDKPDYLALALKDFDNTMNHFAEMNEDAYDFFNYAVRSFTISTYVRIMRTEDRLHGQPHYIKAAKGLLKAYLQLDDLLSLQSSSYSFSPASFAYCDYIYDECASSSSASSSASGAAADADANSKKKAPPPKKKAPASSSTPSSTPTTTKPWNGKTDRDPKGALLKSTRRPLAVASVYALNLAAHAWEDAEAHAILVEYHIRTKQYALALRSLSQLTSLAPASSHPASLRALARFASAWTSSSCQKTPSAALNSLIDARLTTLLLGSDLPSFLASFSSASAPYALRVARTLLSWPSLLLYLHTRLKTLVFLGKSSFSFLSFFLRANPFSPSSS